MRQERTLFPKDRPLLVIPLNSCYFRLMKSPHEPNHQKGVALLFVLLLVFMYKASVWDVYFQGSGAQQPAVSNQQSAGSGERVAESREQVAGTGSGNQQVAASSQQSAIGSQQSAGGAELTAEPSDAQIQTAGLISVSTKTLSTKISLLGGRMTELRLNQYAETLEPESSKLNLIAHLEQKPYPLGVYSGRVDDSRVLYRSSVSQTLDASTQQKALTLSGKLSDGRSIRKTFSFSPEGFVVDFNIELSSAPADSSRFEVEWSKFVPEDEESLLDPYNVNGFTWFDGDKARRESFSDLEENLIALGKASWISMGNKYFIAALLKPEALTPGSILKDQDFYKARLSGSQTTGDFRLYVGPQSYEGLSDLGYELKRNINFGTTGIIAAPLLSLLHFFYSLFGNYGLAIVGLTILVKFIVFPLTATQFKSMAAMQKIQPEMKRLRENVTDKQAQQQQLMALYKKHGVNPPWWLPAHVHSNAHFYWPLFSPYARCRTEARPIWPLDSRPLCSRTRTAHHWWRRHPPHGRLNGYLYAGPAMDNPLCSRTFSKTHDDDHAHCLWFYVYKLPRRPHPLLAHQQPHHHRPKPNAPKRLQRQKSLPSNRPRLTRHVWAGLADNAVLASVHRRVKILRY